MTRRSKLTLEETIQAARRQGEIDEIIQKTLAMSDEEIERELASDGVDVAALDARLAARGAALFAKNSAAATATEKKRSVRSKVAMGFGAGALTTGSVLAALAQAGAITIQTGVATQSTGATAGPTIEPSPAELRKAAFEACGRGHWKECLNRFDEAKSYDPAGDADPEVQAARKRALAMPR